MHPHHHAVPSSRSQPHPSHAYPYGSAQGPMIKSGGQNFGGSHYPSSQQQVNLGDLSAGVTLEDLVPRVSALGFPASCSFVLGLLERYFITQLESAAKQEPPSNPQLARENIVGLINAFVVNPAGSIVPAKGGGGLGEDVGGEGDRVLNPLEEVQLLLTIHARLEEQENVKLRYCIFDAIFSGADEENKDECSTINSKMLEKLISLSVTLESRAVLVCAALWMEAHPMGGLSLARSLFYEFCLLLPNAIGPLLGLASHSPRFAQQMVVAFTTLHPFHVVGELLPSLDISNLHPPIRMLQLVLQWVESNSELFCVTQHVDLVPSRLPLLHPPPSSPPAVRSSVTGVIQWCILAPMVDDRKLYPGTNVPGSNSTEITKFGSKPIRTPKIGTDSGSAKTNSNSTTNTSPAASTLTEDSFQHLLARLHAEVLSSLLSLSQTQVLSASRPGSSLVPSLSSDDVAMIVAALIAFSQKLGATGGGGGAERMEKLELNGTRDDDGRGSGGGSGEVEESVERFAQFLQISMSTKILQLKPEDMTSIASTLPRNRLLDLVISHSQ